MFHFVEIVILLVVQTEPPMDNVVYNNPDENKSLEKKIPKRIFF